MNAAAKTLVSGLFASACLGLVVAGSTMRDRLDLGASGIASLKSADTSGLIASTNDVPEGDFFREMVRLLKREYVEHIDDERKLAIGAVRGMVTSLRDPRSNFMDPEEFRVYRDSIAGRYEGIGAELEFDSSVGKGLDSSSLASLDEQAAFSVAVALPRVRVVTVVPGGPADRAGVKPGDWAETIDGKWVANPEPIVRLNHLRSKVTPEALKGVSPEEAKARQAAYREASANLRKLVDSRLMPTKARDRLSIGSSGTIKVTWRRGADRRSTSIEKAKCEMPEERAGGAIAIRFLPGAPEKLAAALSGKSSATIDLRNNPQGDYDVVASCLSVVSPAGNYGEIRTHKEGKKQPLVVEGESPAKTRLTIQVDETTRGPAEVFALALKAAGRAQVVGKTGGDTAWREVVALSDGSGYTLVTGTYHPEASKAQPIKKTARRMQQSRPVARIEPGWLFAGTRPSGGVI